MAGSSPGIGASLSLIATVLSILLLLAFAAPVNPVVQGATGSHVIRNQVFKSQAAAAPSSLRSAHGPSSSISVTAKPTTTVAATATAGTVQTSRQLRRPTTFGDGAARVLWTKRVLASAQRKTSSPFTYKQPELKIDTMDWTVKHARLGGDPLNGFDVFLTGVLTFNALIYNPNAYGLKINAIYVHAEYNNTFLGNSKLPPMNVYPLKSSTVKAPFNLVNIPMKKGWRIYQKGDVLATKIDIQGFGRFTGFGIKSPVMQVRTTCYVKYVLKGGKIISQTCNSPDFDLG